MAAWRGGGPNIEGFKDEEMAMSQGRPAVSSWKRQENGCFLRDSSRNVEDLPADALNLAQLDPFQTSDF